jgi:hypothetical protein
MHARAAESDPWVAAMRRGEFAAAWRICDRVLAQRRQDNVDCSEWPRHLQFIWNGAELTDRRVLVRCYHGLGDTLQYARFFAPLRRRARTVTVWAQPQLLSLLRGVRGIDCVLPLHDGACDAQFDVDIESMELPHALRLHAEDLPGPIPYIDVSPAALGELNPAQFNVGVAWRAGDWNPERSIPSSALPRLEDDRFRLYSLQYPPEPLPIAAVDLACADIRSLAQRMLALDAVVTVDTMIAHLAGALGLRTLLLLNDTADWRWQAHRSDSPWYPTMRLFRKQTSDWNDVLGSARETLGAAAMRAKARPIHRDIAAEDIR